ncbi:NUDIX hydrolase [Actinomadura roseirufa]|uniref:NUDIX hydrolase n=1 Tax=Actinomadura roseirufa TaxID=2094049 RepID=UPI00104127A6|nr:NUDIX domain-containing protein [Actinomadura roseirufa]
MTPASGENYRRRSARVLLLDAEDRLLLFRFPLAAGRRRKGHCWITPGGGVDDGESPREAAARELREETGLVVAPADLGPLVATTSGHADLGWARGLFRDDFFLYRTPRHDVDTTGFTPLEQRQITAFRWWSLDELKRATDTEPVYPLKLAELLTALLAGRTDDVPVHLPWHH